MKANQVYSQFLKHGGSAAVFTMYTPRVKEGRILHVTQVSVNLYTTIFGDYITAKYISVGVEHGGVEQQVKLEDNNSTYGGGINVGVDLFLTQGDRIFVKIEGTATTVQYEALVRGIYLEKIQ